MSRKRILFLLRHTPYAGSHALEALEAALVAGVFDQEVSVLFSGDGVWQLVRGQNGSLLGRRTVGNVAQALPDYDVVALFVCADSLTQRNLELDDLVLPVKCLRAPEQAALIAAQDAVVND